MTQTPSPHSYTNNAVSNSSLDNATDNDKPPLSSHKKKQQWSLKQKAIALAVSASMLPIVVFSISYYYGNQWIHQQMNQGRAQKLAETEALERQLLLINTGVTAVLAGAIAAFLMNRAVRQVLNTATMSTTIVNRLYREEISTRDRVSGKDELVALEANLRLIEKQLPELLWRQEAAAESQILVSISHRIWKARSEEDVLRTAVEEVRQALKIERVAVFRFFANWDGTIVEESVAPGWPKALWSTIHDPCFAEGYVEKYLNGHVRAIDNIYQAGLNDCYIGLLERFAVKANLIAPIVIDNKLYGLLIAHQCSSPRFWQQLEIDLFAQLAAQVGFALDHARLLEQIDEKADQRQVSIDITRHIRASLHEEDILKTTVEETRKTLRSDRVIVFGFDNDWYGTVLAESVLPGFPKALRANIKDPCFAQGYIEQYQAGRVLAINNIYEAGLTPCHISQLEPFAVKANLVAPILKDDKLFGLLIAHECSKARNWQQLEIDLFASVAAQVGFALDHARLVNQLDRAYQAAETASIEQRQQKQALQRQVLELITKPETAVKTLKVGTSRQIECVQAAYDRIQAVADLVRAIDSKVQQIKFQRRQVSQEVQDGYKQIVQIADSVVVIQQVIVKAAEKIELLKETSQNLDSAVIFTNNVASELNLQAMNVALKISRSSPEEELVAITEKVLASTRKLKASLLETDSLVATIRAAIQEVIEAMGVGDSQAIFGTQLIEFTREKLNSVTTINTQMDSLLEEIAQATNNQAQSSNTANEIILEVASLVNYTSETFMAMIESFHKLAAIAQEFPDVD